MAASTAVLDFTNVKDQGDYQPKRVPEGDYLARITEVKDSPTKEKNEPQWAFKIVLKGRSGSYAYRVKLVENQLWKLRNLFVAAGMNVPKKKIKVDPNKVVGKEIGVTMADTEYNDRPQSEVASVFPAADIQDNVNDDVNDEEEYEDEEEEEEEEPEPAPARRRTRKAPEPEPEEEEEEEEDEEEEEEPAPPRRTAKKAAARRPARKSTADVTDDELEELDIDEV